MALLDAYGRRIRNKAPILDEVGGVSGVRDLYSSYPSQGLTPERLAAIFREADLGDVTRQVELFEEMEEKDAHLGAVLQTRKLAVAGLEWEVAPVSGEREDERAAAFVREALGRVENRDEALLDILDAVAKGFSVLEIMWEVNGGSVYARELRWRHQKRFTFMDRQGVLDYPRLRTEAEPVWGEELPPAKLIVHRYRGRSGLSARAGVMRACAWLYLFKNFTLKDWVVFNERFAMPMRVGRYSPGASEEERRVLRNAVFNLGSDAAAVISESTVVELLEQTGKRGSADLYERLAGYCDRAMSKAVLGHAGSADSTPGRLGAEYEARDVRRDLLEADAGALARTLRAQLVRPLVAFNFGPERRLPVLRFRHEASEDLEKAARTYRELVAMGLRLPAKHVHEKFGVPLPESGEEMLAGVREEGGNI